MINKKNHNSRFSRVMKYKFIMSRRGLYRRYGIVITIVIEFLAVGILITLLVIVPIHFLLNLLEIGLLLIALSKEGLYLIFCLLWPILSKLMMLLYDPNDPTMAGVLGVLVLGKVREFLTGLRRQLYELLTLNLTQAQTELIVSSVLSPSPFQVRLLALGEGLFAFLAKILLKMMRLSYDLIVINRINTARWTHLKILESPFHFLLFTSKILEYDLILTPYNFVEVAPKESPYPYNQVIIPLIYIKEVSILFSLLRKHISSFMKELTVLYLRVPKRQVFRLIRAFRWKLGLLGFRVVETHHYAVILRNITEDFKNKSSKAFTAKYGPYLILMLMVRSILPPVTLKYFTLRILE